MIQSTKGIVLRQMKHKESGVIAWIYTRDFGLKSFFIQGVRRKKPTMKANLFQPLTLLEMQVINKGNKEINTLSSIGVVSDCLAIQQDIGKTSIALFLAEIQYKCIKEEEANQELFDFLWGTVLNLARDEGNIANYHLFFMLSFSKYLGFYPNTQDIKTGSYFDKREGVFSMSQPEHPDFMSPELTDQLIALLGMHSPNNRKQQRNPIDRSDLLDHLLTFYQIHIPNMHQINSHQILRTVFN
jgi:DNA repair protein RecO (recombination protein O)